MYMNFSKTIFITILIMSTLMVISSKSWINCWISLEINLMFFIPLIFIKNNTLNNEFLMKFFFIQLITSMILIMSITFMNLKIHLTLNKFILIFNLTLLMKMGVAPFHYWMIQIIEYLNWPSFFILMTWQKIAPMIMIMYTLNLNLMMIMILINCLTGSINGFNQLYMRKMLFFSSINNMGWLLSTLIMNLFMWLIFFSVYFLSMMILIFLIYMTNTNNMNQLFNNNNSINNFNIIMLLLSLSGLPPLIGFFPKWMILIFFINMENLIIYLMMIITLLNLYFYLRLFTPILLLATFSTKWIKFNPIKNNPSYLTSLIILMIMSFSFFPLAYFYY
uniref:NADH-ubiquinone oxidoreductase chain 2 n=1 Tax=Macrostemum floridum TaxID=486976 RepID=A0A7L8XF28_9NEOP|nr:NADH dehydrogenase subunit 2 [Macrostemum floridum]QOH91252.1 NADH dehydrogenase subunit 2 [Macrostemum floridum]